MVNLGLIKDFNTCPAEIPRLSFCVPPDYCGKTTLLRSWIHRDVRMWELMVPRDPGESPQAWFDRLAGVLKGLNSHAWCVNTRDLVQSLQLPLNKSLQEWGRLFWPKFKLDCLFYFTAENQGQLIRQKFLEWEKKETIVCFRQKNDLTMDQLLDIFQGEKKGPGRPLLNLLKRLSGLSGSKNN